VRLSIGEGGSPHTHLEYPGLIQVECEKGWGPVLPTVQGPSAVKGLLFLTR
jgi:hypothetical protein